MIGTVAVYSFCWERSEYVVVCIYYGTGFYCHFWFNKIARGDLNFTPEGDWRYSQVKTRTAEGAVVGIEAVAP